MMFASFIIQPSHCTRFCRRALLNHALEAFGEGSDMGSVAYWRSSRLMTHVMYVWQGTGSPRAA